jgi:SpoVK/Ycf46/Vps4 family AAA+-type ATPase
MEAQSGNPAGCPMKNRMPEMNEMPEGEQLPPEAATADDNRNPRRRRASETPELGVLVVPEARHSLDRLILAPEIRRELLTAVRTVGQRALLNSVWGLDQIEPLNRCALNFYGAPGTGKSASALAVALMLGKPLYQVDYSAVISKYLGDTAKHITACFKRATELGAVLFFDEADSLLSKRIDMDQSCATSVNQNRNVLMQELDRFEGVVIFTTNLFRNYDAALLRRIARHVEFKLPDPGQRQRILELHFPRPERVTADLAHAAAISDGLSGGDLKVCALNAMFAASADLDPAQWIVTPELLLAEVRKAKAAKQAHTGQTAPVSLGN